MEAPSKGKQPSKAEAKRLLESGVGRAMQRAAANYAMPICWITFENREPLIPDNGSAFMIDCGEGPFCVTAGHVYEAYCDAVASKTDTVCILGDLCFDLQGRKIAHDRAYDVATFRLTPDDVEALKRYGKHVLTGSQKFWPPQPPTIEHGVFFVGFPGDGRRMRPFKGSLPVHVDWEGYTALAVADSVSTANITLLLHHDPEFDVGLRPETPSDWALGGCSGAPLLTFAENGGIFSWRLAGIITECGGGILKGARADCLNRDGTINQYPDLMVYLRKHADRQ